MSPTRGRRTATPARWSIRGMVPMAPAASPGGHATWHGPERGARWPRRRSIRWLLTLHDLPAQRAAQAAANAPGPRQRWLLERERRKADRLQRWVLDAYDRVLVCSDQDAAALGGRAVVVPNGVDTV